MRESNNNNMGCSFFGELTSPPKSPLRGSQPSKLEVESDWRLIDALEQAVPQ
jgi:hypothetical protein